MKRLKFLKTLADNKIGKTIPISAYIRQSFMAFSFLFVFLIAWHQFIPVTDQVLFSAIASSIFLTFVSTSIYESLSTKIIGGQVIGVIVGATFWYVKTGSSLLLPSFSAEIFVLCMSLSCGLLLLILSMLNFEHPPAAGTAMAFVFKPDTPAAADYMFVIICAILLGITHYIVKKRQLIKDLEQ